MDRAAFSLEAAGLGLNLSSEQLDKFEEFEAHLYEANRRMNLTRVPRDECWVRHFLDSLLAHDLFPVDARVLDIGSGPGFPAWPLACARPDLHVLALDSSGKMLGFLSTQPLPNLSIVQERAETWGVREAFDAVTGRALAPLAAQLELSAASCEIGGFVIPMRTGADRPAIERLTQNPWGLRLQSIESRRLPIVGAERLFPRYRKVATTPRAYPRTWAEIRKRPIGSP